MSRKPKAITAAPDVTTDAGAGDTSTAADQKQKRGKHKHAKGFGTLTLRGKTYQARWVVNGKIYVRSTKTGIKKDAEEKLREFTAEYRTKDEQKIVENLSARVQGIKSQIQRFEDGKPSYTPDQAWTAFERDPTSRKRDPATQRNYEQWFGMFSRWLADNYPDALELRNVSSQIAREYSAHLIGRVRGTTHNRHMNALTLIWATLAAKDADGKPIYPEARLGGNPFAWDKRTREGIQRVKLHKADRPHRRRDLTIEELVRIIGTAEGEMRVLIALGFYTGLRLGDCALLTWGNIDRVNGLICVRSRKTDTETATRVHPKLAEIITENVTTKTGYLLPEIADLYNGGITGRVKLTKRIADVFAAAGIATSVKAEGESRARPDCGFHSLRHTYVTQLERLGATLAERQQLAGHNTAAMTLHYTHNDTGRVLALPDITTGNAPTEDAAAVRFRAFCAAWDALETDAERKRARDYIKAKRRGV